MINRKERRKQTGEVFTPSKLTNEILDKLPSSIWEPSKTFCDPACGNGNILIEVLLRKLSHQHAPLQAISTIYGVDLMTDNISECRTRLLKLLPTECLPAASLIVNKQIVCHDALTWNFEEWKPVKKIIKKLF